jgi:hypothetical protein
LYRLEENVIEIPKIKLNAKKLCFKMKKKINAKKCFKSLMSLMVSLSISGIYLTKSVSID